MEQKRENLERNRNNMRRKKKIESRIDNSNQTEKQKIYSNEKNSNEADDQRIAWLEKERTNVSSRRKNKTDDQEQLGWRRKELV